MMLTLPNREYGYNHHNQNKINQRIDDILTDYAKILVVRVDLYIRKAHNQVISRSFMVNALKQVRNNMRFNKALSLGYIGYIAKLEHTEQRGWHYHMALIYDGSVRHKEYGIAKQWLGYWQAVITKYVGSGNIACGEDYAINGTGMVHYSDAGKIAAVKYALSYLAKNDFNAVNKVFVNGLGRNQKSFFMSEYRPKRSARGRPREELCW